MIKVEAKGAREPDQIQAVYLEKLADELSHRGLEAWLMAPPGRIPSLYVVNPAARALEESVVVACGKGRGACRGDQESCGQQQRKPGKKTRHKERAPCRVG